jgi:hypothetical protein
MPEPFVITIECAVEGQRVTKKSAAAPVAQKFPVSDQRRFAVNA